MLQIVTQTRGSKLVDVTVVDILHDAAQAVIVAVAPIIAWKLASLVGMNSDAVAVGTLNTAIVRGVGIALDHGQAVGDSLLANPANRNTALVKANTYVAQVASKEAVQIGVTEQAVATKVAAELALKLHDTNVVASIIPTPAPVTPSVPGQASLGLLQALGNPSVI